MGLFISLISEATSEPEGEEEAESKSGVEVSAPLEGGGGGGGGGGGEAGGAERKQNRT